MNAPQKGIGNNTRGFKYQLLINKAVVALDSKFRQTNLGAACIYYKKAYDSVPHTWTCLAPYRVEGIH